MKTERRWLKSVIAAAREPQPALPFERGARRRPAGLTESVKPQTAGQTLGQAPARAIAAR